MIINKEFIRRIIVFISVIIFSILYLFIGNKIAANNLTAFDEADASESMVVEVLNILDTEKTEYNLGGEEIFFATTISFSAKVIKGELKGKTITAKQTLDNLQGVTRKEVDVGDKLLVSKNINTETNSYEWVAGEYLRTNMLIILGIIFAVMLMLFGRGKGLKIIISLACTCLAVFMLFVPAVLSGMNIYLWAVITCVYIIVSTLLIVYGANIKSLASGIGCIGGVTVSALMTVFLSKVFILSGVTDDDSIYLQMLNPDHPISLKAIIFASIIIGSLGAVMDVSISMASSLTEVHLTAGSSTFGSLFKSGLTIGRDIMGANVNTLILAYIGGSMSVVLLLIANNKSLLSVLNREMIVVEILQALIGSFAILFTIPLTSLICATLYSKSIKIKLPDFKQKLTKNSK